MASKSHLQRYPSAGYDPWYTRNDERVRCSVCGFAGIDSIATQEPEQQSFTTVVTGTTYIIPVGTAASGLGAVLDKATFTQEGARAGCPFCGSPNWAFGSAQDLYW